MMIHLLCNNHHCHSANQAIFAPFAPNGHDTLHDSGAAIFFIFQGGMFGKSEFGVTTTIFEKMLLLELELSSMQVAAFFIGG